MKMRDAATRWVSTSALAAAFMLWLGLPETNADAHQVGLSQGRYDLRGAMLVAELVFANLELDYALPGLDRDHNGAISGGELDGGRPLLARELVARIRVTGDGVACPVTLTSATLGAQDAVRVGLEARCAERPRRLKIRCGFIELLAASHRHLATISTRADLPPREAMAVAGGMDLDVDTGAAAPRDGSFKALLRLGVEHILTGYDHLVFLFGLIVLGGRTRSLVAALTAFTLSHSLSLALAVLGIWAPRPSLVEPAIALSIAYVGLENLWWTRRHTATTQSFAGAGAAGAADAARGRWRITFPFGLVHGFGFAGALAEIGLPRARLPGALLAFNLGVEIGQLGVLAAVLPALTWARRWRFVRGPVTTAANVAIVAAGIAWLVARLAHLRA